MDIARAQSILRAWEAAETASPQYRAAALWAALADIPIEDALKAGIARRDTALVRLRIALFGPRWHAFASCPACADMLEYELPPAQCGLAEQADELEVNGAGTTWRIRWPNSLDLAAAARQPSQAQARALLTMRCLPSGMDEVERKNGWQALAQKHRVLRNIELVCPACAARWAAVFDIGEWLWREVRASARRLMREVDALARTYGWSETEVLALPQARRDFYLELAR